MNPKQSDTFGDNAQNCAELAERAKDEASYKRFNCMEDVWLALAKQQDWPDGEIPRKTPALRIVKCKASAPGHRSTRTTGQDYSGLVSH